MHFSYPPCTLHAILSHLPWFDHPYQKLVNDKNFEVFYCLGHNAVDSGEGQPIFWTFTGLHGVMSQTIEFWSNRCEDLRSYTVYTMKLLIVYLSLVRPYFLELGSIYSPQHAPKTPPIQVLPKRWDTKFHAHKITIIMIYKSWDC
jgi:hypothetical protein